VNVRVLAGLGTSLHRLLVCGLGISLGTPRQARQFRAESATPCDRVNVPTIPPVTRLPPASCHDLLGMLLICPPAIAGGGANGILHLDAD
jgi:hypothetical protein